MVLSFQIGLVIYLSATLKSIVLLFSFQDRDLRSWVLDFGSRNKIGILTPFYVRWRKRKRLYRPPGWCSSCTNDVKDFCSGFWLCWKKMKPKFGIFGRLHDGSKWSEKSAGNIGFLLASRFCTEANKQYHRIEWHFRVRCHFLPQILEVHLSLT